MVAVEVDQGALASVVASTPTQSRPKCWLTVTSVIDARNSNMQPAKMRSGSLRKIDVFLKCRCAVADRSRAR